MKQAFRLFSSIDKLPPQAQVNFWGAMVTKGKMNLGLCLLASAYVAFNQDDGASLDIHKQVDGVIAQAIEKNRTTDGQPLDIPQIREQLNKNASDLENITLLACAGFSGLSLLMLRGSQRRLREAAQKLKP
jgi:hypothetical protein